MSPTPSPEPSPDHPVRKIKRWRWKKPKGKPKRSLSAYNFFYQHERENMLRLATPTPESVATASASIPRNEPGKRIVRPTVPIALPTLTRMIGAKWRELGATNPALMAECQEQARLDKIRYKQELDDWNFMNALAEAEQSEQIADVDFGPVDNDDDDTNADDDAMDRKPASTASTDQARGDTSGDEKPGAARQGGESANVAMGEAVGFSTFRGGGMLEFGLSNLNASRDAAMGVDEQDLVERRDLVDALPSIRWNMGDHGLAVELVRGDGATMPPLARMVNGAAVGVGVAQASRKSYAINRILAELETDAKTSRYKDIDFDRVLSPDQVIDVLYDFDPLPVKYPEEESAQYLAVPRPSYSFRIETGLADCDETEEDAMSTAHVSYGESSASVDQIMEHLDEETCDVLVERIQSL